jgi:hypothetical protein
MGEDSVGSDNSRTNAHRRRDRKYDLRVPSDYSSGSGPSPGNYSDRSSSCDDLENIYDLNSQGGDLMLELRHYSSSETEDSDSYEEELRAQQQFSGPSSRHMSRATSKNAYSRDRSKYPSQTTSPGLDRNPNYHARYRHNVLPDSKSIEKRLLSNFVVHPMVRKKLKFVGKEIHYQFNFRPLIEEQD